MRNLVLHDNGIIALYSGRKSQMLSLMSSHPINAPPRTIHKYWVSILSAINLCQTL